MGIEKTQSLEIPVTGQFVIRPDIDLKHPLVEAQFQRAARGETVSHEAVSAMIRAVVGPGHRFGITHDETDDSEYNWYKGTFNLSGRETIAGFMKVAPDNLPPNIPKELTPELFHHLVALHEAEHVTQTSFENDKVTGKPVPSSGKKLFVRDDEGLAGFLPVKIIGEADADNTVLTALDQMELPHVSQFWLDMRICASFTGKFFETPDKAYKHETSSVLSHFRETGDVLDMDIFIPQKNELMAKIQREVMGFDMVGITEISGRVLKDYPRLSFDQVEQFGVAMQEKVREMQADPSVQVKDITPQGMMSVVGGLLEAGKLGGLQKWEAENYMAAMNRLGYEAIPQPKVDIPFEEMFRDVLENKMGLKPINADLPAKQHDQEKAPPVATFSNGWNNRS